MSPAVSFDLDNQAQSLSRLARPPPRIVSIVSGKGGVGKTFVSTSLALIAAQTGKQVLLIDGDLSLANVDIALNVKTKHHLGDVIAGRVTLAEAMVPGPQGLFVLPASAGVAELANMSDDDQRRLLGALRTPLTPFDLVVIDCGAGVGDTVIFFGRAAHESVVVLTPEPTALADAYATIKVLATKAGVSTIDVIVNQASETAARDVFKRLSGVVGRFLPTNLRYAGSVPLDDAVRAAVLARQPVMIGHPESAAGRAIDLVGKAWLRTKGDGRIGLLGAAA
jgi:flagellar biosynthesis protein FlhG